VFVNTGEVAGRFLKQFDRADFHQHDTVRSRMEPIDFSGRIVLLCGTRTKISYVFEPKKREVYGMSDFSLKQKIKTYFVTGLLVVVPIGLTLGVVQTVIGWIDGLLYRVLPALPREKSSEQLKRRC
jgi:hypothetical protein